MSDAEMIETFTSLLAISRIAAVTIETVESKMRVKIERKDKHMGVIVQLDRPCEPSVLAMAESAVRREIKYETGELKLPPDNVPRLTAEVTR